MVDTICFPPHEGLPFDFKPPTPDGFVEPDFGVASDQASDETGWTRSTRITEGSDTHIPNMEFQCIRHNSENLMYLSFIARLLPSFDSFATVIVVLQPNFAGGENRAAMRRLDIVPVRDDKGAGPTDASRAAGITDDADDIATDHVRTNRQPINTTFYKWGPKPDGSIGWVAIPNINNYNIRVRSWDKSNDPTNPSPINKNWSIEVQLPTTPGAQGGGNDWIDLTTANFGLYVNVVEICKTCPTGPAIVRQDFSTQYTWPPYDYTQTPPLRIITDPPAPAPSLQSLQQAEIPFSWLGEALLGAASCRGVRFLGGISGIGIKTSNHITDPLGDTVDTTVGVQNTFAARLINDVPPPAPPAPAVQATFRYAKKWGIGPAAPADWEMVPNKPSSPTNKNPTDPQDVPTGTTPTEFTVSWKFDQNDHTDLQGTSSDKCLWVTLDSAQSVTFAEDSVRRNLSFINLSNYVEEAAFSGKGYAKPLDGSNKHDFLLYVSKRKVVSTEYTEDKIRGSRETSPPEGSPPIVFEEVGGKEVRDVHAGEDVPQQALPPLIDSLFKYWSTTKRTVSSWLWILNGYRGSGHTLTLGGQKFGVFEQAGGFAYVATHPGEGVRFNDLVDGQHLVRLSEDVYYLPVPVDGEAVIKTGLEALDRTGSGFMVQGTYGTKGNFEVVVPHETAGLAHCVRDNDDEPSFPWRGPVVFGQSVGRVDAVALVQSNIGFPGHLEVVARVGSELMHFWRDSGPEFNWHGPELVASGVSGNPALIQGQFGHQGNFELVVPLASGGIAHYWRNNDVPNTSWTRSTVFGTEQGNVDAVTLIQSNYERPGNLEVVARVGDDLMHFWRDSGPELKWHGPFTIFSGASGMPGFIQSNLGSRGHFQVVTPLKSGGMMHLQRNNDFTITAQWDVVTAFGNGNVTAVSLIQSNFTASHDPNNPGPGDFEVAARIDNRTAHFWRRDEAPFTWTGPTAYACS